MSLFNGKRLFNNLSCAIEQDSFSIVQRGSNCFQSDFQIWQLLKDRGAIFVVHHGSQEVTLTHELLVALH
jgi:hypothetical protein